VAVGQPHLPAPELPPVHREDAAGAGEAGQYGRDAGGTLGLLSLVGAGVAGPEVRPQPLPRAGQPQPLLYPIPDKQSQYLQRKRSFESLTRVLTSAAVALAVSKQHPL